MFFGGVAEGEKAGYCSRNAFNCRGVRCLLFPGGGKGKRKGNRREQLPSGKGEAECHFGLENGFSGSGEEGEKARISK